MMRSLFFVLLAASTTWATTAPTSFAYQGRLFKSNGIDPVDSSSVNFTIQVRSPNGACLLFEETHFRNLSNTDGTFTLIVGEGTNTNATALNVTTVFDNNPVAKTGASCSYTPSAGDFRKLRLTYDDGVETVTLSPDQTIRSVPYALMANSLQGLSKNQFIQTSAYTTQARVDAVMNGYAALMDLINGNSTVYAKASDAVSTTYVDSHIGGQNIDVSGAAAGYILVYNGSTSRWEAKAPAASLSGVNVSGDLLGAITSPTVSKIRGVNVSSTSPTNGQVLKYNSSSSQWEPSSDDIGNLSGFLTGISVSGPLSVTGTLNPQVSLQNGTSAGQGLRWNGSAWQAAFNSFSDLRGVAYAQQFPTTCTASQVWSYSTVTDTFSCVNISISGSQVTGAISASSISGNIPSTQISGNFPSTQITGLGGAATLNVGTTAGTVAAGNDSRLTGSLQSSAAASGDLAGTNGNPTVSKIRGVTVSSTAPTNGQVLKYNSTTSQWEASADNSNSGTVTSVAAGTGLTGGTIISSGTVAVDVGTTAGKIVQLDSSARLPAVDGSLLTNVNVSIPFKAVYVASTAGAFSWTPPAGITKIYVEVWGAGGGGSGGRTNAAGGFGGGAGAFGGWFQTVTPGVAVTGTIGAGGSGGAANSAGSAGGNTLFESVTISGGAGATTTAVGAGGSASGSSSVIGMAGGNGSFGSLQAVQSNFVTVLSISVLGSIDYAGLGGAGGNAVRGGNGGNGSASSATAGSVGNVPGGGGGGGGSNAGASGSAGGAGANGRVVIWY